MPQTPVVWEKTGREWRLDWKRKPSGMDAPRLIAWVVGLVEVAAGIAVIASDTTFFQQPARLPAELPTISSHLGALIKDTRLIGWGLLSFVMILILLWIKLR